MCIQRSPSHLRHTLIQAAPAATRKALMTLADVSKYSRPPGKAVGGRGSGTLTGEHWNSSTQRTVGGNRGSLSPRLLSEGGTLLQNDNLTSCAVSSVWVFCLPCWHRAHGNFSGCCNYGLSRSCVSPPGQARISTRLGVSFHSYSESRRAGAVPQRSTKPGLTNGP